MRKLIYYSVFALVFLLLFGCGGPMQGKGMKKGKKNISHAHMGHVGKSWKDTPGRVGFLTILEQEAKIAKAHIGYSLTKPGDLANIQTHTKHVRHAIDASSEAGGPGKGYGVLKAANGVDKHINFAASSKDASKNVKTHAVHMSTSAKNIVGWAGEIMALSEVVLSATSAEKGKEAAQQIQTLVGHILEGFDANGDGSATWEKGEGGIEQIEKHFKFMKSGEGMDDMMDDDRG